MDQPPNLSSSVAVEYDYKTPLQGPSSTSHPFSSPDPYISPPPLFSQDILQSNSSLVPVTMPSPSLDRERKSANIYQ